MKAVMLSVYPKWCELIANGKKTVEVRKSRPKLETPFKCYIYCTLSGSNEAFESWNKDVAKWNRENWGNRKGRVIGEFICNDITRIQSRGIDDNYDYCYESLNCFGNDDIETEIIAIRKSCIKKADLNEYGKGTNALYGWHISDLKIYDEPKDLCDFALLRNTKFGAEPVALKRPPQSWCYVEELAVI